EVIATLDELESDPARVKILIPEEVEEDIPAVTNLQAHFNEQDQTIELSWGYEGPHATFEVNVEPGNQTEVVRAFGLTLIGVEHGQTYTMTVTAIGDETNERGDPQTVKIAIPQAEEPSEPDEQPDHGEDEGPPTEPG